MIAIILEIINSLLVAILLKVVNFMNNNNIIVFQILIKQLEKLLVISCKRALIFNNNKKN